MTLEQKTRTLAAAAGCLAVLGSAVCEAAEEGREATQEKAQQDVPVKVCPSSPRQEAPAMPSLESVLAVWGFPMKMLGDGYVEYDGWVGRQEFGTVMAFWKADSRTSAWYGLMNFPEDLTELSLRFKYIRTTATRFEVDCEGRRLRAVERVAHRRPLHEGRAVRQASPLSQLGQHLRRAHRPEGVHPDRGPRWRDLRAKLRHGVQQTRMISRRKAVQKDGLFRAATTGLACCGGRQRVKGSPSAE